jgi:hypothetical protein
LPKVHTYDGIPTGTAGLFKRGKFVVEIKVETKCKSKPELYVHGAVLTTMVAVDGTYVSIQR